MVATVGKYIPAPAPSMSGGRGMRSRARNPCLEVVLDQGADAVAEDAVGIGDRGVGL